MPRRFSSVVLLAAATFALPARADTVSDALDAARSAYAEGKLAETAAKIAEANVALSALQSAALLALLPPAPDGWTRTENTDMTASMVILGGGSGIEATYSGPEGQYFTLSIFADNPMFLSMKEMYNNPMLATMMGGKTAIGGAEYLTQAEDSLFTIVGERLLVQATGAPAAVMTPVLAELDYDALAAYGQ